jgi:hypothetical protein
LYFWQLQDEVECDSFRARGIARIPDEARVGFDVKTSGGKTKFEAPKAPRVEAPQAPRGGVRGGGLPPPQTIRGSAGAS